jgi:hypothetical protein
MGIFGIVGQETLDVLGFVTKGSDICGGKRECFQGSAGSALLKWVT